MSKEEKIKQAFGKSWNKLTDSMQEHILKVHHWVDRSQNRMNLSPEDLGFNEQTECEVHCEFWRPIQLKGIETNEGWIKIESEEELPKESWNYWIMQSDNRVQTMKEYDDNKKYYNIIATHYQPIVKPKPPIY